MVQSERTIRDWTPSPSLPLARPIQNATSFATFEGYAGAHWPKETAAVTVRYSSDCLLRSTKDHSRAACIASPLPSRVYCMLPTPEPVVHRRAMAGLGWRWDAVAFRGRS
jgi:hypothetical protein